jgi:hypothetical protein
VYASLMSRASWAWAMGSMERILLAPNVHAYDHNDL